MAFGPRVPPLDSCSARVVSHHLDGLLRTGACGFVAPRFRPLGSLRFVPSVPRLRRGGGDLPVFPAMRSYPSKGSPRQQPYRITAAVAPLPLPRTRTPPTCRKGVPPHPKAPRWAEVDDGGALVHRGEPPHRCRSVDEQGVTPAPHELRSALDHRAGSPLPENLQCSSGPRAAGFEALLHSRVRCRHPHRCRRGCARSFHGLHLPFKILFAPLPPLAPGDLESGKRVAHRPDRRSGRVTGACSATGADGESPGP
jgi:hypothetical protein